MKRLIVGSLALALAMLMSGCANKVHNYSVNTKNVMLLKDTPSGSMANVGKFSDSGKDESKVMCRLATPIGTPNGETFASYMQDSLTQELMMADRYDSKSTSSITANLDDMYGSTILGNAYWEFKVTVNSSNGTSYKVHTKYDYESSFTAYSACAEMQRSFVPAIQKLNNEIIKNPKFTELLSN